MRQPSKEKPVPKASHQDPCPRHRPGGVGARRLGAGRPLRCQLPPRISPGYDIPATSCPWPVGTPQMAPGDRVLTVNSCPSTSRTSTWSSGVAASPPRAARSSTSTGPAPPASCPGCYAVAPQGRCSSSAGAPVSGLRAPAEADACPETGRGRLSYPRAEYLFKQATAAHDPHKKGWTLHQLRHFVFALFPCSDSRCRWASGTAACAFRLPSPRCRL